MKKIILVLLLTIVLGGCSCNNENCECPPETNNSTEEYINVITDYSELYKQTVQSVVMLRVQRKNDKNSVIATGSGVVVMEQDEIGKAYVVTNAHVIKGLTSDYEVEVIFSDEEGFASGNSEIATVKGKDSYEDVAILEINKSSNYKVATLGDSYSLNKGEFVYTIGSPLGYFNYTTSGNISTYNYKVQLDSSNLGVKTDVYAILFDAAINEGNSGGALFNKEGKLIGITTFKYDKINSVEVAGMYGALPIDYFMKVAKYLLVNNQNYIRPSLSIDVVSINELGTKRDDYGISGYVNKGVYVLNSTETQQIPRETIITKINNTEISSASDFYTELLKYKVGDTITLEIVTKNGLKVEPKTVILHA